MQFTNKSLSTDNLPYFSSKIIRVILLFFIIVFAAVIIGCNMLYFPNIQQGNSINSQEISKLKIGMDKAEVEDMLGFPILQQNSGDDELIYVYTFQPSHKKMGEKRLRLTFNHNKLAKILSQN